MEVYAVKLRVPPCVYVGFVNAVFVEELHKFRLVLQLFSIQTLPNPNAVKDWIAIGPSARSRYIRAIVCFLVRVMVTFRAALQCFPDRPEILPSMFVMATRAS